MMRRSDLEKYSSDKNIPFRQVLGWYVMGLLLYLSEKAGFADRLVLISPASVDPNQDLHILFEGIDCVYLPDETLSENGRFVPGCPFSNDFRERLMLTLQQQALQEGLPLIIRIRSKDQDPEFYYDEMYVPLSVRIRSGEEVYPERAEYKFFDPSISTINVMTYPAESMAAQCITDIMKYLELVTEMEVYLRLYYLLMTRSMSGRDVCDRFKEMNSSDWKPSEKKYEIFLSYRDSSYMKKKWKVLLRRHSIKEPSWENVMDLIIAFIKPLYESLKTDTIFFGDWMPDLGRYLD